MAYPFLNHASLLNAVVSAAPSPNSADGLTALLTRALDEVDYALMLFQRDQRFQYGNHLARAMLNRGDRLYLDQGQLKARVTAHQSTLQTGFAKAAQGVRCLLDIPTQVQAGADSALALVPLGHPAEWPSHAVPVLLISCRPALCAPLSLRFFAQANALTRTEEAVLGDLTQGLEVEEIARQRDMAVSTARSHVKQLRLKTRSGSMRELLNKLAMLPPVVSAVRSLGP